MIIAQPPAPLVSSKLVPTSLAIGRDTVHRFRSLLAAVATLLAFNGFGWLRRRRKGHPQLIASGSAAQAPMPESK